MIKITTYSSGLGDMMRSVTDYHGVTVKGVAILLARYLNDGDVRKLLETARQYNPRARLNLGGRMGDDVAIRPEGYRAELRGQETITFPWETKTEELMGHCESLVTYWSQYGIERPLRELYFTLGNNLASLVQETLQHQGQLRELVSQRARETISHPQSFEEEFEAFLREVSES